MQIRPKFTQIIADKLVPGGQASEAVVAKVKPLVEQASTEIATTAGDEVELNFERVAKAVTGGGDEATSEAGAAKLKAEAQPAIDSFGNTFMFGYGSFENDNFQSYGDGIFSFEGGNGAQPDVTFVVDTSPGADGIQWMLLDNTKLP